MKIIYVANARMPTEKAHGYQIVKMCEAFAKAGVQLELVVPWRFNQIKENAFDYYNVPRNFKITKIPSLDLLKIGSLGFFIQSVSFAKISAFYLLFKKVDLIYSRDELPLFFLSLVSGSRRKFFWESHSGKISFVAKRVLKKSEGIIVLTKILKDFYVKGLKVNSEKILVSPDGVDLSIFDIELSKTEARRQTNLPEDKMTLGYFGRFQTMGMEKGIADILEALKLLPENFIFLAIGGSDEDIKIYKKISEEKKLSERVMFLGPEKREKSALFQKSCDILLMPFPDLPHYRYYMSPLKMFEYMASKKPIITTDLPAIREVLSEEEAIIITPGDPEKLCQAVLSVLNDPEKAQNISQNAYEKVKDFTWDKRAKKILKFIKNPN